MFPFLSRSRIKKLEQEGESLEKSFLNYLERQKDKKDTIETDRIKLWHEYQMGRRALQAHQVNMPRTSTPFDVGTVAGSSDKGGLNYDEMATDLNSGTPGGHRVRDVNVVNPFKTFDTATYLQKAHERRLLDGPKIERLEAYRRLDREVENIKRKVFMDHGFKPGASNMYLNPRGGSIFGASRYLEHDPKATEVKEKEIQTDSNGTVKTNYKEVKWHEILTQTVVHPHMTTMPQPPTQTTTPTITVEVATDVVSISTECLSKPETTTLKPPLSNVNPSSDRSSPLKSDLDLGELTLDIELSKTTKSSSGNSSQGKPIPGIGIEIIDSKSPLEKGANDAKEKETWGDQFLRSTISNPQVPDDTVYRSLLMPVNVPDVRDAPDQTTQPVKDAVSDSSDQKSSTFETEIDRMTRKAHQLNAELSKDLKQLLPESKDQRLDATTSDSHIETQKSRETQGSSEDSSEHYKISTGKPSSSETSEDFWK